MIKMRCSIYPSFGAIAQSLIHVPSVISVKQQTEKFTQNTTKLYLINVAINFTKSSQLGQHVDENKTIIRLTAGNRIQPEIQVKQLCIHMKTP